MKKPVVIREFENITCNEKYNKKSKEATDPVYIEPKHFDELKTFLINSQNKISENENIADFFGMKIKKGDGKTIHAKNYVGLVQLNSGFQVEILPKIYFVKDSNNPDSAKDADNSDAVKDTRKIFLQMLKCMKDFPSKVFTDADLKADKMNLYEIFIRMFILETEKLVKRGLRSTYTEVEENLNFFKGKLLVKEHISKNIAHKERAYVRYDEYNLNRAENKLIKATLLKLNGITQDLQNSKEIKQLLVHFEEVETSTNHNADFSKCSIDKRTKEYETLMPWVKVFLLNKSFTTFAGDDSARALLFPMEKLFEAYVAKLLKKKASECKEFENWTITTQDKKHHLFDEPRKFALRPDIVMQRDKSNSAGKNAINTIILDTKWKNLINNESKNYGISQTDMYQMYAYAKKYKTSEIYLIYPLNEEMIAYKDYTAKNITFTAYENKDEVNKNIENKPKDKDEKDLKANVHIFFVDLESKEIEASLMQLVDEISKSII